jgi:hypothetical protein
VKPFKERSKKKGTQGDPSNHERRVSSEGEIQKAKELSGRR